MDCRSHLVTFGFYFAWQGEDAVARQLQRVTAGGCLTWHDDHAGGLELLQDVVRVAHAQQAQPQEHARGRRLPLGQPGEVLLRRGLLRQPVRLPRSLQ